jgi:hypothetical protein
MSEEKTPPERYREIHGFDESQARGKSLRKLPKFGNIQEVNPDVDRILDTWKTMNSHLTALQGTYQALSKEIAELVKRTGNVVADGSKQQDPQVVALRSDKNFVRIQIHRLQKKLRRMQRLSYQEAYLQACSEFYLLRQQEEVETRIAIEQAKCFKRELGPSVNDIELMKEQRVLKQWQAKAERYHQLHVESRKPRGGASEEQEKATTGGVEDAEATAPDTEIANPAVEDV